MEWFVDPMRGAWLQERITDLGPMVPSGMPAYARILHPVTAWPPMRAIESVKLGGTPELWSWADVAAHYQKPWDSSSEWSDIVDQHSAAGWEIHKPHDGWIDPLLLASLVPALRAHTSTPAAITLAVWEGWGFAPQRSFPTLGPPVGSQYTDATLLAMNEFDRTEIARAQGGDLSEFPLPRFVLPDRRYVLGDSSLSALEDPNWPHDAGLGWEPGDVDGVMPQLIWPADKSWCISVEVDAPYTIVAGARSLIAELLAMPDLESQVLPPVPPE